MDNEPKKISFAFSKFSKKSNLLVKQQPIEEKKVEIIEYLEEKSIKVVGGDDKPKGPLIIPMKQPNKKLINLVEIVKNDFKEPEPETNEATNTENGKAETSEDQKPPEDLTLEEQAARELLNDSHNNAKAKDEVKRVIDASKNSDKLTFEGEKESTIDDYEDIPIDEFGKAMLRGMGWKDGHGIGKNEQLVKVAQPLQRPKGMGLGADKLTKQDKNEKPAVDRDGNPLKCVKKAYVKIIAGYHKGQYGQITGLDDESGRFIIKTAINHINVSLNEFLVTPVTKEEYTKNSKVINNAKYEEFVKKKELEEEMKLKQANIKQEKESDSPEEDKNKKDKKVDRKGKSYDRSDSEERRRDKDKKYIKKERRSSESDAEDNRSSRREKNKEIKKEDKYEKRTVRRERRSSESDHEENKRNRKDKYEQSTSKYDSDDNYKREESRDRKGRDKYKQSKSKHYSDDSDSEKESEKRKTKKKSSKHDSDTDDYQQSSKKKHKKKKSKKHSSEDSSEEKYKRKSKKTDRKKHDGSDSEYDEKSKKSQKKDKHRDKRDRSRHDKESRK